MFDIGHVLALDVIRSWINFIAEYDSDNTPLGKCLTLNKIKHRF